MKFLPSLAVVAILAVTSASAQVDRPLRHEVTGYVEGDFDGPDGQPPLFVLYDSAVDFEPRHLLLDEHGYLPRRPGRWRERLIVEEHFYTIELVDARVASIRTWMPNNLEDANRKLPVMEEIHFVYDRIITTSETSGVSSEGNWEDEP